VVEGSGVGGWGGGGYVVDCSDHVGVPTVKGDTQVCTGINRI
jgi:hypothetical protein